MHAPSSPPEEPIASPLAPLATALMPPWRPLTIIRAGWGAIATLCLALLIAALPQRLAELMRLASATGAPRFGAVVVAPMVYVACALALELIGPIVFFTLSALIVWRRSDDIGAIRISALLLAFGGALPGTAYAIISATPIWRVTPGLLQTLGWTSLLIFACLFPDGEWVPRWSRWLMPLWMLWTVSFFAFAEPLFNGRPALIFTCYLIWIAWLGAGACAQMYRYLWVANAPQRQQTKWVMLGFIGALIGILLVSAQQIVALSQGRAIQNSATFIALALVIITLSTLPIPFSIAIAILRHNLFDIDRLINLTLVYGALTVSLGAIYAAAVGLSQIIIQAVTGRQGEPQLALVLSTLGAAALFQPLRRRIQVAIDRQFYRKRYDAAQTAEAFAASLRTELDLSEISQRLVEIAYRTMKPKHAALWLARPQPPARPGQDEAQTAQLDDLPPPENGA